MPNRRPACSACERRGGPVRQAVAIAIRSAHFLRARRSRRIVRSRRDLMPAERKAVSGVSDALHVPALSAPYAPADEELAARLLAAAERPPAAEARIDTRATRLIKAIRARAGGVGGIEDFLHEYALSTKEGLALMVLAEALLRVPDNATADRLIEDKLTAADFPHHEPRSDALLVSASAWALGVSARIFAPEEQPENVVIGLVRRLGQPAVRAATRQAMRLLGSHFVLGQTIEEALGRAGSQLHSFDMLGEGART